MRHCLIVDNIQTACFNGNKDFRYC
ncbi:hypothetical protein CBM2608_B130230 [Cupriavidus taiwanensis]|nr:hypothetical protein CBM2608_B130230 [Cupriavidus taiwanensis]SOZ94528.1 hypothetical protein CBM2621_B180052 [Cupriavidus taiwanensis]SPA20264.1 hypothetical protein CBM2631_B170052 [Cupriavidus taiwanensis]